MIAPDALEAESYSALGDRPLLMLDARAGELAEAARGTRAILIGLDPAGALPDVGTAAAFDILLTTAKSPPAPWVAVPAARWFAHLARIEAAVQAAPIAAQTGARLLRIAEALPFDLALEAESHAYSMLLAGAEFRRWRAAHPPRRSRTDTAPEVRIERADERVTVTLADAARRNALTAAMRDRLFEALAAVVDDPSRPALLLRGAGKCFSVGGDLDEFGTATDPAAAHAIRLERNCTRLLHRIGNRAAVAIHGACVGSGLELAAAAARRVADPSAWFQLPELRLGLVPGAGGTASVSRAIGRHRAAWMLLSGVRVPASTALRWRLVHEIAA